METKFELGVNNIFYINLDRSPKRNASFLKEFENFKETPIRIPAIDGLNHEKDKHIEYDKSYSYLVQACAYSHITAIIKAYNMGLNEVIILEDDARFEYFKFWKKTLRTIIDSAPKDMEAILLSTSNIQTIIKEKKQFVPWHPNHWGTFSYYITRKGMEKILNIYYKYNEERKLYTLKLRRVAPSISNPALLAAENCLYTVVKTYTYTKPLINYYDFKSDIHTNHRIMHVEALLEFKKYFYELIDKNDVNTKEMQKREIDYFNIVIKRLKQKQEEENLKKFISNLSLKV
tara:strand:- start:5017 stop:5883 length:867 start_codon:yes stop_codon:yes gene_type:complete